MKNRHIAYITYDSNGNPGKIYFTNGSVTKYKYSATGQKLGVEYYVAAPNVTVAFGAEPDALTLGQTLYAGSTQYLLGGSLVMKDGLINKFLFDGGYAQATAANPTTYSFSFYYYNQDHLGNNREVVDASGTVRQATNYYPFGTPYTESSAVMDASLQPYKYNGKELDRMHGLNTYDYGARQYDPVLGRWDRMDPLCEKYYDVSPYGYCHNNPVMLVDPDGKADYFTTSGKFVKSDNNEKDPYIYIQTKNGNILLSNYNFGNGHNNLRAMMRVTYHYSIETGLVNKAKSIGVDSNGKNINDLAYTNDENRVRVHISNGHFPESLSQIENFKSTLRHEEYHIDITDSSAEEVQVIMQEMEHPDFSKTTQSFKDNTSGYLQQELVKLYKENPRGFNKHIDKAKKLLNRYNAKSTFKYINGGNEITF